jgi:TRAP transporter TAXI family solute receptor
MWDAMFLYMMLDNSNNSFAYNQYNNAGYQGWRQEANMQARENAELRAKLDRLDREVSQMSGTRDTNYLPEGVDADIALSQDVTNAVKPTLTICTGGTDGMYYYAGNVISNATMSVDGKVLRTEGTMDNLKKIDAGHCDAAFVQRDGYWIHAQKNNSKLNYSRIPSVYTEYAHLICNTEADINSIDDLDSGNTVLVGYENSGSYLTWANFVAENSDYADVNVKVSKSMSGNVLKVTNGQADCLLAVTGINARSMRNAVQLGSRGELKLANIEDGSLDNLKDPGNKPIYKFGTIKAGTYGKLQSGWLGSSDIDTITVDMDMIISNKWKNKNPAVFDALLEEINSVIPSIRNQASGR